MFTCDRCGQAKETPKGITTGYGSYRDRQPAERICYACCGELERCDMVDDGRAVLYLTGKWDGAGRNPDWRDWEVTNWPGTLRFRLTRAKTSKHNMARVRVDVWFTGPDGRPWHGYSIGDHTQICHCRRTKG